VGEEKTIPLLIHQLQKMVPMFRILSIDGGGIKGVFPASFLANLEESLNIERISDYFDLIAGTSTGGIIALGLGMGMSAREILDFYKMHGPKIFGDDNRKALGLLGAKYSEGPLREALHSVFENRTLGESSKRLLIPAVRSEPLGNVLRKTRHHADFNYDHNLKVVDVALATAAAPTFFNPHHQEDGFVMLDGGLWANNPCDLAVIEAMRYLGQTKESIQVLSLGCTREVQDLGELVKKTNVGIYHWFKFNWFKPKAPNLIELLFAAQVEASLNKTKLLIGCENLLRIDSVVPTGKFPLDKVSEIEGLIREGVSAARNHQNKVQEIFLDSHVQPFSPVS
jgi:uncharacterized protein